MEKKLKAMAARAASPACAVPGPGAVRCHWLVRKQKPTNHRKDQSPADRRPGHARGRGRCRGERAPPPPSPRAPPLPT